MKYRPLSLPKSFLPQRFTWGGSSPVSGRRRAPTPADLATIAGVLLLVVGSGLWMPHGGAAAFALVQSATVEQQVRLDVDQTLELEGPLGMTIVRVQGGSIWIETASSQRQLCRRMGRTNQPTRALVCIPNDIRIRVIGEAGEIDAIAR